MTDKPPTQPFWQHLPQVLRYPLYSENLLVIALLALLGWAGQVFLLLLIPAWLFSFSYGYGVLMHTARGNLLPRSGYFDQIGSAVVWKQLGLWLLFGAAVFLTWRWAGGLAASVLAAGVLVALPVATMSLAFDQNLEAALNPLTWKEAIGRIGWRYAHLLGLITGLMVMAWLAASLAALLPFGRGFTVEFVSRYALVAVFYLLGYVIFQYHREFGMDVDPVAELIRERADGPAPDPDLLRAQALVDAGDPTAAQLVLRDALARQGALSALAEPYRQLCASMGDEEAELALYADQLLILLPNEDYQQATAVLQAAIELAPELVLRNPDDVLPFAKHLLQHGQSELALAMCHQFDQRYRGHRDRIGNGFLAAQILSDRLGRDGEALVILRQLERDFSNHPQLATISAFRDTVTRRISGDSLRP